MTKLSGLNIINLFKSALDETTKINPISVLTNDDLDFNDPIITHFIEKYDGCHCCKAQTAPSKEVLAEIYNDLTSISNRLKAKDYRSLFSSIQNALNVKNEAVVFERIANKYEPVSSGVAQIEALSKTKTLIKSASTLKENDTLKYIYDLILSGEDAAMKVAAGKARELYASVLPQENVKLAMTSLTTQQGEPYQMCPKMIYQLGHAVAMEVSKCRDNCIDVKVAKDGSIGCAYADWVKRMDNHNKAMNRLEVHIQMDEDNRLELKDGEREKAPTSEHKTLEQRGDETRTKKSKEMWNNSIEQQLGFNYKRDVEKAKTDFLEVQMTEDDLNDDEIDDKTIEQILENDDEAFSENELDFLETRLRESEGL